MRRHLDFYDQLMANFDPRTFIVAFILFLFFIQKNIQIYTMHMNGLIYPV